MSSLSRPSSMPEAPHTRPGALVDGKYRVEGALGSGGMGTVVRAMHLTLREPVALKFLHSPLAANPTQVQRFLREAKAVVRIKSEHVAGVLDVGLLPTGEPFIVMDLLVGQDLSRTLRQRGPLPVDEAIDYVLQACRAIAEAHRHGIVHRDLKPANLFLTHRADGSPLVKVLDFGISKMIGGTDEVLTATSDVLGSPVYMSPEQIRDVRHVDGRSDIWALGSILYKFLAGDAPFAAETPAATLARIIADPVPPLRARRPDVSIAIEQIVLRCLEKTTDRRFQRVEELVAALESARAGDDAATVTQAYGPVSAQSYGGPASASHASGVSVSSFPQVVHPPSLTPAPFAGTQASSTGATASGRWSPRVAATALAAAGVLGVVLAIVVGVRTSTPAQANPVLVPSAAPLAATTSTGLAAPPSTSASVAPTSAPTPPAAPASASADAPGSMASVIKSTSTPSGPRHVTTARPGAPPPAPAQSAPRPRPVAELPKYGQE